MAAIGIGVGVLVRKLLRLLAVLAVACASPAFAQVTHIAATLVPERVAARPGDTIQLAIVMKPEPGWHGYWENGGDAGFAMQFKWTLAPGAATGPVRYPVPETLLINGLMNHVYEHDYALLVPFTLPRDARSGDTLPVSAEADWLACTEEICVPEHGRLAATVRVGTPTAREARFDGWSAKLPAPLPEAVRHAMTGDVVRLAVPIPATLPLGTPHLFMRTESVIDYAAPQRFNRKGDLLLIELKRAKTGGAPPEAIDAVLRYGTGQGLAIRSTPGAVPTGGEPLATGSGFEASGFLAVLGGALLGGLLLNVMPCVFPILSLKALSLANATAAPGKAHKDGLAYTAGVVLACLVLGVAMLALRAAGTEVGWAFQLQEPLVVAGLLLLAAAITANLAGLYELPSLGAADGERGAFATGLLAAFVATPCTGPFMAAAVGAALVLPPVLALAVFAALGLGLALPFLALGFVPALRRLLPRPGPWMATFRKAMAVPMGLTGLALLWLAWRIGGAGFAGACLVGAALLIALLAYAGSRQRRGLASGRAVVAGVAVLAVAAAVGLPPLVSASAREESGILAAAPFSDGALAKARDTNRPVFVYFTADWCLTCKVNEAAAIERESTLTAFNHARVAVLRGDWTRRDPAITRFLAAHGAAGVPLYLWYAPGAKEATVLPQVLTPTLLETCAKGGTARTGCG